MAVSMDIAGYENGANSLALQAKVDLSAKPDQLLDTHNQVLRLIAHDADLTDCLHVIAAKLGELSIPNEGLIIALDPETNDVIGLVATSAPLQKQLSGLISFGNGLRPEGLEDLLSSQGIRIGDRHPINSHSGHTLGTLLILNNTDEHPTTASPEALESLKLLTGYAIESTRRTQALVAANERFAALTKSVPGVVYQRIVRPNGDIRYTYISDAAQDLFGVSPDEILSNPQALFDCHGPEYYATFRQRLLDASRELRLWDVEATIITRDGTRKYTHAIARPHREADGSVIWNGVILDQTRIKEAELEATAASARTRDAIIESIPQAFALYDAGDQLVTWNSRFLQLYPELAAFISTGTSYEALIRAEIEFGIDPLSEDMDVEGRINHRLAQHQLPGHVIERQLPNGRWILINEHRTSDGGIVVLHTDITEFKDREAALARSNRELEAFASIASHDLQEPLRKIDAFGDRLKRKYHADLGDDGKMYIDRMQNSVVRMRALINDLLDYSRVTTKGSPFSVVNLTEVLHDVVSDLEVRIEEVDGEVIFDELPSIDADRTQMRQLFQNLIANALKFHRKDVRPKVEISASILDKGRMINFRCCRIEVADNGIGFDMKYADRIFGIFQRLHTRNDYEGTGVGLATCRKIAERHQGDINVQSECDQGTVFSIEIPIHQPITGRSSKTK